MSLDWVFLSFSASFSKIHLIIVHLLVNCLIFYAQPCVFVLCFFSITFYGHSHSFHQHMLAYCQMELFLISNGILCFPTDLLSLISFFLLIYGISVLGELSSFTCYCILLVNNWCEVRTYQCHISTSTSGQCRLAWCFTLYANLIDQLQSNWSAHLLRRSHGVTPQHSQHFEYCPAVYGLLVVTL